MNENQISNLITYYNETISEIKKNGTESELDAFMYHFASFMECMECDPVFECEEDGTDSHLVDVVSW